MKRPLIPTKKIKFALLPILALTFACGNGAEDSTEDEDLVVNDSLETTYITVSSTVPQNPSDQSDIGLAKFAWEQFIALNWQSSWDQPGPNSALRGTPDTSWDPATQTYSESYEVVWETYAHVTELRPGSNNMLPFDDAPHYSYLDFKFNGNGARSGLDSTLFNNLDEDSEIGSCNVYPPGTVVDGKPSELVLYQAKTNRDEYDYVLNNYPDSNALNMASTNNKTNILAYSAYYDGLTSTCDCDPAEKVICLPCGGSPKPGGGTYEGAIEVKTGWRKAKPGENTSTFFTRNNIYYLKDETGKLVYDNAEFVLIGIHIIHKTVDNPEFIFASWEHNGVEAEGYELQLLNNNDVVGDAHTYTRYVEPPSYLDEVNNSVHDLIASSYDQGLGIWKNYNLIGVQGSPTDYADRASDANYFMANYVIESNKISAPVSAGRPGLANFHGYGFASDTFYTNNEYNLLISSQNKFIDAGGCIGCHGVAQTTEGTDFSFLLDQGAGKPVANPATINTITPAQKTNMKLYFNNLRR